MAKNIYDLFNERKYGVDFLVEGVDASVNVEAYEDLDEACDALDNITLESSNEVIELQAAWYLEDLVIENMMYNDFDEERIVGVMEGSGKGKVQAAKEKIMGWWKKIKEWFAGVFKSIVNHFKNGEALVRANAKRIPEAMRNCKVKVKMNKYKDLQKGMDQVADWIGKLEFEGINDGEEGKKAILKVIGAEDNKDVAKKVRALFIEKEGEEQAISGMNVNDAMNYASNKKIILDKLKRNQRDVDASFKATLAALKEDKKAAEGDAVASVDRQVANFQFALGVKNTILNTQIKVVKRACDDYTKIIRKALSKGGHDDDLEGMKEKVKAGIKDGDGLSKQEDEAFQKGYAKATAKTESFLPALEGVEFIENNDDYGWDW